MSERLIPNSWFRAQTRQTSMGIIMPNDDGTYGAERLAPVGEGERALSWFILPPFQRPPVWTQMQQIRLVESAWVGLPIGVIVYNRDPRTDGPFDNYLLDGQQRITALMAYMADEFPVFGYRFSELTSADRRRWSMSTALPLAEMTSQNLDELHDVYDRLAYGGTAHEPKS